MVSEPWIILLYHVPAALFGLAVHEFGHAWAAVRSGDRSAINRLSLNPLVHLELPWGLLLVFSGFWLRPFPDVYGGRKRVWVAVGGPLSNVCVAMVLLVVGALVQSGSSIVEHEVRRFVFISASYQIRFAAVNLFPIPPLDGARIIAGFMPQTVGRFIDRNETAGLVILVLLLVSGSLDVLLKPLESLFRMAVGFGFL